MASARSIVDVSPPSEAAQGHRTIGSVDTVNAGVTPVRAWLGPAQLAPLIHGGTGGYGGMNPPVTDAVSTRSTPVSRPFEHGLVLPSWPP